MLLSARALHLWALVGLATGLVGCGSRTVLRLVDDEAEPQVQCELDSECDKSNLCAPQACLDGVCQVVLEVDCGPPAECETLTCNPQSGSCEAERVTEDLDGDGHYGPLPGTTPGSVGSCGSDCDDTSPLAFPGGAEVCDGADNDCDGIVDNGSEYTTYSEGEIPALTQVPTGGQSSSGRRGVSFGDGVFALGYWANEGGANLPYLRGLNGEGLEVFPETPVANVNAPSFGTALAWSGASFGAAWSDPRVDDNYEVYFARFDSIGNKLGPDVRVTEADNFSIHPRIIFDQGRFVLVWDDRRDELTQGVTRIMAQLIDADGKPIGPNVVLSGNLEAAEYPQIAATTERLGVVYTVLTNASVSLTFRSFDKEFNPVSTSVALVPSEVRAPRITATGELFVVTWEDYGTGPGPAIMGMVLSQDGQILVPAMALTGGAQFARGHATEPLGDRFLLTWTDDFDGNYELYAKVLDVGLGEVEPRRRLTFDDADTIGAEATLGDRGKVGILFDDWRSGTHQTYFLTVGCRSEPIVR